MASSLDRRQEERSGLIVHSCGLGTMEGEEQKVLSPSLVHSYANPHAHEALGRPVDRRRGGETRLSRARVIT
jgi:hypothetical protein